MYQPIIFFVKLLFARHKAKSALFNFYKSVHRVRERQRGDPISLTKKERLKLALKNSCFNFDTFKRIFTANTFENSLLKNCFAFLAAQLIGFIIYISMILDADDNVEMAATVSGIATMFLTTGILVFPLLRALIIISLTTLLTKCARTYLILVLFVCTLHGPALNVQSNILSTLASVKCVHAVVIVDAKNVAKTELRQAFAGFSHIGDGIKSVLRDTHEAVITFGEFLQKMTSYMNNTLQACQTIMLTPYDKCRSQMYELGNECRNYLAVHNPLRYVCDFSVNIAHMCETAKLLTAVCKMPHFASQIMKSHILPRVKSAIMTAVNATKNITDFEIEYYRNNSIETTIIEGDLARIKDVVKKVQLAFETARHTIKFVARFISMLLPFYLMLTPLLYGIIYMVRYRISDTFDNYYCNQEVRSIDVSRATIGKETLLPLLSAEKKIYVQSILQPKMTGRETSRLIGLLVISLAAIALPIAYVIVDWIIYLFCSELKASLIDAPIDDDPAQVPGLKATGGGTIARIYNRLLQALLPNAVTKSHWQICFDDPIRPDAYFWTRILAVSFACLVLSIIQIYIARLRHLVCDSYFPNKCRRRALTLYAAMTISRMSLSPIAQVLCRGNVSIASNGELATKALATAVRLFGTKNISCIKCGFRAAINADCWVPCLNCHNVYCKSCHSHIKKCIYCDALLTRFTSKIEYEKDSSESSSDEKVEGDEADNN